MGIKMKVTKTIFLLGILLIQLQFSFSQPWTSVGTGMNNIVYCLQTDTINNLLYAGGFFTSAGSTSASCIASWNGVTWSSLSTGISSINGHVRTMTIYNGELYVGGHFSLAGGLSVSNIAKWNGSNWSGVGSGLNSTAYIESFAEYNGELYVGGYSLTTAGTVSVNNIAKWNGSNWSSVGLGVSSGIQALCVYGNELYAAGEMTQAGIVNVSNIAKWDGNLWSDVSGGLSAVVFTLCVYNNELYAGGNFSIAGGITTSNIAKWNGSIWDSVSSGIDYMVDALTVYNGSLYAGGLFWNAGGISVNNIARWNGLVWDMVGNGFQDTTGLSIPIVKSFAEYNSCLHAGGVFNTAIGSPSNYIAKWDCNSLGTEDVVKNHNLVVFPNPCYSESLLNVDWEMKDATIILYNSMGNKVRQYDNIDGRRFQLNSDHFNSGLYYVKIIQENSSYNSALFTILNY